MRLKRDCIFMNLIQHVIELIAKYSKSCSDWFCVPWACEGFQILSLYTTNMIVETLIFFSWISAQICQDDLKGTTDSRMGVEYNLTQFSTCNNYKDKTISKRKRIEGKVHTIFILVHLQLAFCLVALNNPLKSLYQPKYSPPLQVPSLNLPLSKGFTIQGSLPNYECSKQQIRNILSKSLYTLKCQ